MDILVATACRACLLLNRVDEMSRLSSNMLVSLILSTHNFCNSAPLTSALPTWHNHILVISFKSLFPAKKNRTIFFFYSVTTWYGHSSNRLVLRMFKLKIITGHK